jgi:tRNA(Ile)-lysidine synthase
MSWQDEASYVLLSHVLAGSRLLVAVSGGPDSVALLHFLRRQPYSLVIGHVDHHLRKGSARDARFVERLAHLWDIPCRVKHANVPRYAKKHHLGLEEAARNVRYQALADMAKQAHCSAIVTAHTADDQSETVLMNFLRGAGPTGLSGMATQRELNHGSHRVLVRPFLGVRRKHLMAYLRTIAQAFREDPTNASLKFTRNRIRLAALPYLEKHHPGLRERLAQVADIFRQEEEFWDDRISEEWRQTVRRSRQGYTVVLPRLLGYHKALSRRILRRVLPGSSFQDIEQVLHLARSPKEKGCLEFGEGWRVRRDKERLIVQQKRNG